MKFSRFAVYHLPTDSALAEFGAAWLGWDVAAGCAVQQPAVPGLADVTGTPRKYGFHATLKPPFKLADGIQMAQLHTALQRLAVSTAPARCAGLELIALGRFLALVPLGDASGLDRVASACVTDLDMFRAPMSAAELERRRAKKLSARQEELLQLFGYPHVLDQFRLHFTLTGRLPQDQIADWRNAVGHQLPDLPTPFVMDQIALVGEREDGFFELIQRYALTG